jgi:hypothetical protein
MIKVNELRVGNIVLYTQDNDELPVLKIDGDSKTVCLDLLLGLNMELNEQDIDPVPLTPEWLKRCGFTTDGSGDDNHSEPLWEHPKTRYQFSDGSFVHNGQAYDDWHDIGNVKYVHQLQNLYFALTGEELQIKII